MSDNSRIEWTDATWNPVTGCTAVSSGCVNCYARRMAHRFLGPDGFKVTLHPDRLEIPLRWRKPRRVFVNSMSDLFHPEVSNLFITQVFRVMNHCERHTFQVLTKRPQRIASLHHILSWTPNIWAGVTVENQEAIHRIVYLRDTPAAVRFLSCEPLLSSIELPRLNGIHWIIAGGENGPGARPMREEWAAALRDQAIKAGIPFFFKGHGGKQNTRELDGRLWNEYPARVVVAP
jgi:protein gp37